MNTDPTSDLFSELQFEPAAEVSVAPVAVEKDAQINVYNFHEMSNQAPSRFAAIRFDPNNTCNLHCVYCHNRRSDETIETEDLRVYLDTKVVSVKYFQIGCVMEPTLDKRLADLMLLVSQSRAKPSETFMLQTNGILLHKHDMGKMREAGLSLLSVSVDSAEPATQKVLRDGTSLDRVVRNLKTFRENIPETKISFIATITKMNVTKMRDLVQLGLDLGVSQFIFREVFYRPEVDVVDHVRMPELLLKPGQFNEMKRDLLDRFNNGSEFYFADAEVIDASAKKMREDSIRKDIKSSSII